VYADLSFRVENVAADGAPLALLASIPRWLSRRMERSALSVLSEWRIRAFWEQR